MVGSCKTCNEARDGAGNVSISDTGMICRAVSMKRFTDPT